MKFVISDDTDKKLVKVIVHEFSRAQLSFDLFTDTHPKTKKEYGNQDFKVNLVRYNAYALFVQHLYE